MQTAREQAREAALKSSPHYVNAAMTDAASAASNVWEPILTRLIAKIESRLDSIPFAAPEMMPTHMRMIREAIEEAREALDG